MKILILLFFTLLSARSEEIHIDGIPEDIKIPVKLWDRIEKFSRESDFPTAQVEDEVVSSRGTIQFFSVTVVLSENNPGVLKSKEVKIHFPQGGGYIDLSKYVGDKPGSFFVRFDLPDKKNLTQVRSYFVSRSKKRKLDGDIYGSGCNRYFDITSQMAKKNAGSGLKVNTTRERHVSVLGGHFIFAGKKDKETLLSQVTFFDTKNSHLLCEGFKVRAYD